MTYINNRIISVLPSPVRKFQHPKLNRQTQTDSVSFGVKLYNNEYNLNYLEFGYNGLIPDEFLLKNIDKYLSNKENPSILDIGAGDGRNAIPLAKKGYKVSAYEIASKGRKLLTNRAKNNKVDNNLCISDNNVLNKWKNPPKHDLAYMSHVSQHFNLSEMDTVFKNLNAALKKDGIFIFDALLKEKNTAQFNTEIFEHSGIANFDQKDLVNLAKDNGFKLLKIETFKEKGEGRASYEQQKAWGGNFNIYGGPNKKLPVKLKWMVFKKIGE